jgi:hypothetical protein
MTLIRTLWQRFASTRLARALESAARAERALNDEVSHQRAEIDRLRAENRALLNSILGIAGIPPIPVPAFTPNPVTTFTPLSPADGHSESPTHSRAADESLLRPPHLLQTAPTSDSSSRQSGTRNDSPLSPSPQRSQSPNPSQISPSPESATQPSAPTKPRSLAALPTRRRSWHQINRLLEIESARKPVTSD